MKERLLLRESQLFGSAPHRFSRMTPDFLPHPMVCQLSSSIHAGNDEPGSCTESRRLLQRGPGVLRRLVRECGDEFSSASHRASIYLNTNRWRVAADSTLKLQNIDASESLIAAFALFELGRMDDAVAFSLHGALNFPQAVKILVGIRTSSPKDHDEAVDYNTGVDMCKDIGRYLSGRDRKSTRFFKRFIEHPRVRELLGEIDEVKRTRSEEHRTGKREAFDRMMHMQSPEFTRREAPEPARSLQAEAKC
jgi:hypothetical protein